jgi:hypothetical protein
VLPGHPFTLVYFELRQRDRRHRVDTVRMPAVTL